MQQHRLRQLQVPVALFIFKRPETTIQVLERIAEQRPEKLLVVGDGARPDRMGETEAVERARSLIAQRVDWPCSVQTNFAAQNMGCRQRISSGLDWVFSQVPEAIILEDDCLPDPSFFQWCAEMLSRHRNCDDVMMVAGTRYSPRNDNREVNASYYYSRFSHIWGWATWARAWARYDVHLTDWPALRESDWLATVSPVPRAARYYRKAFDDVHARRLDTWDFQWDFAMLKHRGLSVVPEVNLITNLGVGPGATNTLSAPREATVPSGSLAFPLRHPGSITADVDCDRRELAFLRPQPRLRRMRDAIREQVCRWAGILPRY